jgi:hypothetical protein
VTRYWSWIVLAVPGGRGKVLEQGEPEVVFTGLSRSLVHDRQAFTDLVLDGLKDGESRGFERSFRGPIWKRPGYLALAPGEDGDYDREEQSCQFCLHHAKPLP